MCNFWRSRRVFIHRLLGEWGIELQLQVSNQHVTLPCFKRVAIFREAVPVAYSSPKATPLCGLLDSCCCCSSSRYTEVIHQPQTAPDDGCRTLINTDV